MEYASFVKELTPQGYNSPRCPPDTEYAREFEHQMAALVVNYEISDDEDSNPRPPPAEGGPDSKGATCSKLGGRAVLKPLAKAISFSDGDEETPSDRSFSESEQELRLGVPIHQRSSVSEAQYSFDSGQGFSCSSGDGEESNPEWKDFAEGLQNCASATHVPIEIDHSKSSMANLEGLNRLESLSTIEESANMSWQNETTDEGVCSHDSPMNSSIFITKLRTCPMKRTYDEANS